eukprot:g9148.t1
MRNSQLGIYSVSMLPLLLLVVLLWTGQAEPRKPQRQQQQQQAVLQPAASKEQHTSQEGNKEKQTRQLGNKEKQANKQGGEEQHTGREGVDCPSIGYVKVSQSPLSFEKQASSVSIAECAALCQSTLLCSCFEYNSEARDCHVSIDFPSENAKAGWVTCRVDYNTGLGAGSVQLPLTNHIVAAEVTPPPPRFFMFESNLVIYQNSDSTVLGVKAGFTDTLGPLNPTSSKFLSYEIEKEWL